MLLFTARVVVVVVVGVSSLFTARVTLYFADMGDGEDEETELEVVQEEEEDEVAEELKLDWGSACFFFESGGIWSDSIK